jgi:hypothetical protein
MEVNLLQTELQGMMPILLHMFHAEDIHIEMQALSKRAGGYHEVVYLLDFHCWI